MSHLNKRPVRAGGDRGFTLTELLVTIIIIGVIAAIAVPVFMHQRNKGFDAATKSDLRNAAVAAQANAGADGYANLEVFTASGEGQEAVSKGGSYVGFADRDGFVIYGQSRSGRMFTLDSRTDGTPKALASGAAPSTLLASISPLAAAAAGTEMTALPAVTDTPPAGISVPYAAVKWGTDGDGKFEREARLFTDGSTPDPGEGGTPGGGTPGGEVPVDPGPEPMTGPYAELTYAIPAGATLNLPLQYPRSITVDWGDGARDGESTHVYSAAGTYTVKIQGRFSGYSAKTNEQLFSNAYLVNVVRLHAEDHGIMDMGGAFRGAGQLTSILDLDTTGVTAMNEMFSGATNFNGALHLDTSQVTTMASMFGGARAFNRPVEFDTSNVTDMTKMFYGAAAFNQPVNFDTSKVTAMTAMFQAATSFNQPVNFASGNVQGMSSMFRNAMAFNSPLTLDTRNVTNMQGMFASAIAFNQPLTSFSTPNLKKMGSMFDNADAFNQPLAHFDTRYVTDMAKTFYYARSFNQNLSGWNVSSLDPTVGRSGFSTGSLLTAENLPRF